MKDLKIEWTPSKERIEEANVTAFIHKYNLASEDDLNEKSVTDPEWFWKSFLDTIGWFWHSAPKKIFDDSVSKPWTKWFVNSRTNFVYNCLDKWVERGHGDRTALIFESEEGDVKRYSYAHLLSEVKKLSEVLTSKGIKSGDRVGIHLPLIPEVAISLLAVSRIGAIAVPLFSGFGSGAINTRLKDSEAKLIITADGLMRRGKPIPMKPILDEALRDIPSVEHVIVVKRTGIQVSMTDRDTWYHDEIAKISSVSGGISIFDGETPFMLIYTSGTTGKPKATVHVHTGFPIKAAQDMYFLFDVGPDKTIYWVTDIGWMMGPWLILGALILGATIFMFDGSPDYPTPDRLWKMVDKHGINILGITPTLIRALIPRGEEYPKKYSMESLIAIGSTGEPWNPDPWRWTLEHVGKSRVPIINYSGGTEISGGILGCYPTKPLKPCSFNTVVPGVDADIWDENGHPVVGEPGYLVLKNHNPGMTRGFWQSPERYIQTYWARWENIWEHGDLVMKDREEFWFILGRADDTLKVAGKRIGPAEVESIIVEHPAVKESAVIGIPDKIKGEVPIAFVSLNEGVEPSDDLSNQIFGLVVKRLGKPLALKGVYFVSDIPKTRNAKIMRRLIKAAFLGKDPGDTSALLNPEVLKEIANLRK